MARVGLAGVAGVCGYRFTLRGRFSSAKSIKGAETTPAVTRYTRRSVRP